MNADQMRHAALHASLQRDLNKIDRYLTAYAGTRGPLDIAWSGYQHPEAVRTYLVNKGFVLTGVNLYGATINWS